MKKWANFKAILEKEKEKGGKKGEQIQISFQDATSEVEFLDKIISSGSSNSDMWSEDSSQNQEPLIRLPEDEYLKVDDKFGSVERET